MIGSYFSNGAFVGAKSEGRNQLHRNPSGDFFFTWGYILFFILFLFFLRPPRMAAWVEIDYLFWIFSPATYRTGRRHGPQIDTERPVSPNGLIGAKNIHFYFARKSSLMPLKDHYTPWPHGPIRPELFS